MALPFIALVCPIGMPVLIIYFFPHLQSTQKYGVYLATVLVLELVRNLFYIVYGCGLEYLLHDVETQLVSMMLIIEQLVLGAVATWFLALLKRSIGVRKGK